MNIRKTLKALSRRKYVFFDNITSEIRSKYFHDGVISLICVLIMTYLVFFSFPYQFKMRNSEWTNSEQAASAYTYTYFFDFVKPLLKWCIQSAYHPSLNIEIQISDLWMYIILTRLSNILVISVFFHLSFIMINKHACYLHFPLPCSVCWVDHETNGQPSPC